MSRVKFAAIQKQKRTMRITPKYMTLSGCVRSITGNSTLRGDVRASRAAYFRQRRETLRKTRGMQEKRLFQQGVEALRKTAIEVFRGIGLREMNGYTAAEVVKDLKLDVPRGT